MHVYRVKGRQRAYGGHVTNLLTGFPRAAADVPVLVVRRQRRKDGRHQDIFAKRIRVLDDLVWLPQHNPYYQHGQTDNTDVLALLEDGQLAGLLETTEPVLTSASDIEQGAGPEQVGATRGEEESESFQNEPPAMGG